MSLLTKYEERTVWKYDPIQGTFHTAEGLTRKVREDGTFATFPGTTVVFRPGKLCLQVTNLMQRFLYHHLGDSGMLSQPLPASTIHMTLHDLISPDQSAAGDLLMKKLAAQNRARQMPDGTWQDSTIDELNTDSLEALRTQYQEEIRQSLSAACRKVEDIRREFAGRKLTMVADRIVNMVSSSLVLMLKPQTEQDYELLLDMYRRFDDIVSLPYQLTPHITLAYFRPGMLDGDRLGSVVNAMQIHPENAPVFDFYPEGLTAQSFLDMASYLDVPRRICFCCDGGMNRSVMAASILNHLAKERGIPMTGEARAAYPDHVEIKDAFSDDPDAKAANPGDAEFRTADSADVKVRAAYSADTEVRAAYSTDTEARARKRTIPAAVWRTLEKHGIEVDAATGGEAAPYLEDEEVSFFSQFAEISDGARDRISWLTLPDEKAHDLAELFYGVGDPQYGENTYEKAFSELYERVCQLLDVAEAEYSKREALEV